MISWSVPTVGRGVDVGLGRGDDRREILLQGCGVLARRGRLERQVGDHEVAARDALRVLADHRDELAAIGQRVVHLRPRPAEVVHQRVEVIPVIEPLLFERELFGEHEGQAVRRPRGVRLLGPGGTDVPQVVLFHFRGLAELFADLVHHAEGVVARAEEVDEYGIEVRGGGGCLWAGLGRLEVLLVARDGAAEVAGHPGVVRRKQEDLRRRGGVLREIALGRLRRRIGPAEVLAELEHLRDLLVGRRGRVFFNRVDELVEDVLPRIGGGAGAGGGRSCGGVGVQHRHRANQNGHNKEKTPHNPSPFRERVSAQRDGVRSESHEVMERSRK